MGLKEKITSVLIDFEIDPEGLADVVNFIRERLDEEDQKILVAALDKTAKFTKPLGAIIEGFDGQLIAFGVKNGADALFELLNKLLPEPENS